MVDIVPPEESRNVPEKDPMPPAYRRFREDAGVPVHSGLYVDDVYDLETGPWERTGQRGALINLLGMEGISDLQVHDIAPGGETETQHHGYQEIVYVLSGDGLTTLGRGEDRTVFEWKDRSLFVIPRNTPYRHVNASSESDARLISHTDLPLLIGVVEDEGSLFDPSYDFWARHGAEADYSAGRQGTMYEDRYEGEDVPITWEANFIPDTKHFDELDTDEWSNLGAIKVIRFPFPLSNTHAHISHVPVGKYKNAHRHGPGANIFAQSGEAYTLLWREEWDERIRIDWSAGSVFTPPAGWYHHHFNVGDEPAEYFAMHAPPLGTLGDFSVFDSHQDYNIIDYHEEDPSVRALYERELEGTGVEFAMPEACYTDPDYSFEV